MRTVYLQVKTAKQYCLELANGNVTQFFFQTASAYRIGDLVSGVVQDIDPRIQAAFIDLGNARAYMPLNKQSQSIYKGKRLLLQVEKTATNTKRMTVSSQLELSNDYIVFFPNESTLKISSKMPKQKAGDIDTLLKEHLSEYEGVLVRTAAQHLTDEQLVESLNDLKSKWKQLQQQVKQKLGIIVRQKNSWDEYLQNEIEFIDKIVCDDVNYARLLRKKFCEVSERIQFDAHFYRHRPFTWTQFSEKFTARKVKLDSGAELVIDRTEAMTVIDVNTAHSRSHQVSERFFHQVNKEAAIAALKEVNFRKISGIILIDFINLKQKENRKSVETLLKDTIQQWNLPIQVAGMTKLGLMELTAKRAGESIYDYFQVENPTIQHSEQFIVHQLEDELLAYQAERVDCIEVAVEPDNLVYVKEAIRKLHQNHQFTFSLVIHADSSLQSPFKLFKIGDVNWLLEKLQAEGKPIDKLI
ncbi:ribonuclease E/G [Allobacillus sp. GCM10007491]|uniref:Ribonuclease E/G n=1 Tax=Allobacillus saliphilus TaxID=2912308 RepID=A0A941CTH9_9BACI|nr:ribonuclease E/G [Allobacillus saliphilus]MBR7553414.1 ribonuclease E/G [Allobacillus saliphilus]